MKLIIDEVSEPTVVGTLIVSSALYLINNRIKMLPYKQEKSLHYNQFPWYFWKRLPCLIEQSGYLIKNKITKSYKKSIKKENKLIWHKNKKKYQANRIEVK